MNKTLKFKIGLFLTLITFVIGVMAWFCFHRADFQKPQLDIPNANWEKIFFKEINNVTNLAELGKLREKRLPENDIEIRIWEGFGLEDLEGMIFTRKDNFWTAYYVKSNNHRYSTEAKVTRIYNSPKSGWKSFMNQLYEKELLTLPDSGETDCEVSMIDGRVYVVEIYKDKIYRTYKYVSVSEPKCEGGRKINEIAEIIAKEYYNGIDECKETEWIACLGRDDK